jgi:hypothetical protein
MGGRPVNVFTRQKAGGDFLPTVIAANPGGTAGTGPAQAAFSKERPPRSPTESR